LERHDELVPGQDRYSRAVRAELLAMSSATIDRYLRPARARDQIKGKSTTKASPLLRSAVTIRKATDEVETAPGFFEGDTVAHCGPTLKRRVRPHPQPHRCAYRLGLHPHRAQQRPHPHPRRPEDRGA
jgi:hypothetical protein